MVLADGILCAGLPLDCSHVLPHACFQSIRALLQATTPHPPRLSHRMPLTTSSHTTGDDLAIAAVLGEASEALKERRLM
jgi:hypothetical protein